MRDKVGRGEKELTGDRANVGGRGVPSPSQHQPQLLFIEHWSPLKEAFIGYRLCVWHYAGLGAGDTSYQQVEQPSSQQVSS